MLRTLKIFWLNATFFTLFLLFSATAIPLLSIAGLICWAILPKRIVMRRFRRAISFYGTVIIRVLPWPLVRVDYRDCDPNPGGGGPYVFVANHRAASDAFLLACLPYEVCQVAKSWPFRLPVLGRYARWAGYLSVTGLPFEEFLARAAQLISQGVCLAGFPEGTRSGDRHMGPFNSSLFRVAIETRCPLVPLCITGNEGVPPRGSLLLRPTVIRIRKLPAVTAEEYQDMTAFKLKNHVHRIMEQEIERMDAISRR